jgi:hypothetical protein
MITDRLAELERQVMQLIERDSCLAERIRESQLACERVKALFYTALSVAIIAIVLSLVAHFK